MKRSAAQGINTGYGLTVQIQESNEIRLSSGSLATDVAVRQNCFAERRVVIGKANAQHQSPSPIQGRSSRSPLWQNLSEPQNSVAVHDKMATQ
jgi:hypothetical protein